MADKQDYVVEVSAPFPTYLAQTGDEDDGIVSITPPMTTDPLMALRFVVFKDARKAVRDTAKLYPANAFKVGVLPPL